MPVVSTGVRALIEIVLFNLLCPPLASWGVHSDAPFAYISSFGGSYGFNDFQQFLG